MDISVFGLGYVGCITAACLAQEGHRVIGVDINAAKVQAIDEGRSPLIEKGLYDIVKAVTDSGHLSATQDAGAAVTATELSLVCVGTPSQANGGLDLDHVQRACEDIGRALANNRGFHVVVIRSTVLPGSIKGCIIPALEKASGKKVGMGFGVVANPEFLREGSGVYDFYHPPFTLIGEMEPRSGDQVAELYQAMPGPMVRTDLDTAEMVKYACNAFHALKIAFANEIGNLCKVMGLDSHEVMEIFCLDRKLNLSACYLKPGFAFGGSCLPKDLRALLYLARHSDLRLPVLESILPSNHLQIQNAVDLILRDHRRKVGIIGLSFKPDTDDLRESPIVELVETLSGKGVEVKIYDENVNLSKLMGGNKAFIERVIPHISALMCASMEEVVESSDVIVVAHDLRDSQERLTDLLKPDQLLIDFVKIVSDGDRCPAAYEGICW